MDIKCFPGGMYDSNCYVVESSNEGIIIDAGVNAQKILDYINSKKLVVKYIFLTHGHIDHICHIDDFREKIDVKVLMHQEDNVCLVNASHNYSSHSGENKQFKPADVFVKDGDVFDVGNVKAEIIHTPGHSRGGICIKIENIVFTGDTLFNMSIGRTDLNGGSKEELLNSIEQKLLILDDKTVVYPGHGKSSTIEHEKSNNLFLRKR